MLESEEVLAWLVPVPESCAFFCSVARHFATPTVEYVVIKQVMALRRVTGLVRDTIRSFSKNLNLVRDAQMSVSLQYSYLYGIRQETLEKRSFLARLRNRRG